MAHTPRLTSIKYIPVNVCASSLSREGRGGLVVSIGICIVIVPFFLGQISSSFSRASNIDFAGEGCEAPDGCHFKDMQYHKPRHSPSYIAVLFR